MLASPLMMLLGVTCNAQSSTIQKTPTATVTGSVDSKYGPEYVLDINGQLYRAVLPEHARAILTAETEASRVPGLEATLTAANALIDQQKSQITDLKRLADLDTKLIGLQAQLLTVHAAQHADAVQLLSSMKAVEAGSKANWVDRVLGKWPVTFAFKVGLPLAVDAYTFTHPPYSPPSGSMMTPCR